MTETSHAGRTEPWRATVLSIFPEMFPGPLGVSLVGQALANAIWSMELINLRDFGLGRHRQVDDTPAGGGAGMVMRPDVLGPALDQARAQRPASPLVYLSPRGEPLTQGIVREFSSGTGVTLLAGRFEGIDQRVIDARGLEEVSVGDYILSGGEPAALVMLDAIVRLLPGIMGNDASGAEESFENGLLEHPHYTRPADFEGVPIPDVLTGGNHARVAAWRHEKALALTAARRPDLLARARAEKDAGDT